MHESPRICDFLDNAVSERVGNTASILVYLFNSASMLCCEVWALQFPFHNFKDTIPPSEACLYGHINWSVDQARQQLSLGLFQSSVSMRSDNVRPKAGF